MVDKTLLINYAAIARVKLLMSQMPEGMRDINTLEKLCLDDIRQQVGEDELLQNSGGQSGILKKLLPLITEVALPAVKKHWPTATWVSVLSAIISYLVPMVLK